MYLGKPAEPGELLARLVALASSAGKRGGVGRWCLPPSLRRRRRGDRGEVDPRGPCRKEGVTTSWLKVKNPNYSLAAVRHEALEDLVRGQRRGPALPVRRLDPFVRATVPARVASGSTGAVREELLEPLENDGPASDAQREPSAASRRPPPASVTKQRRKYSACQGESPGAGTRVRPDSNRRVP
jgi:hypothetical protein